MNKRITSTRASGMVLLVLSIGYGLRARTFELTTMTDPVGPRAFPYIIAILTAVLSLYLIVAPDAEGESWPSAAAWLRAAAALAVLVGYAYLLVPIGFVAATTLAVFAMAMLFRGPVLSSALSAVAFSLATYILFVYALGLALPTGWLFS